MGRPGEHRAPQRRLWWQPQCQERALIVADRVARPHEQLAVLRGHHLVSRLFDVGHEHGLRRVARDGDRQGPRRAPSERREAERDHRRGLAAGDDVAEIARVRWFEAARLTIGDLAGADDIDCHAADLTLGRRHAQNRNGDRTVARRSRFGGDEDRGGAGQRLEEGHDQRALRLRPVGRPSRRSRC